jgi:hypothetical protein
VYYNTTSQFKRGFNEFDRKGKGKIEEHTAEVNIKEKMLPTGWLAQARTKMAKR